MDNHHHHHLQEQWSDGPQLGFLGGGGDLPSPNKDGGRPKRQMQNLRSEGRGRIYRCLPTKIYSYLLSQNSCPSVFKTYIKRLRQENGKFECINHRKGGFRNIMHSLYTVTLE